MEVDSHSVTLNTVWLYAARKLITEYMEDVEAYAEIIA